MAASKGDWDEGTTLLTQAMDISLKIDNQNKINELKSMIGILRGNIKLEDHLRNQAKLMGAKAEKKSSAGKKQKEQQQPQQVTHSITALEDSGKLGS